MEQYREQWQKHIKTTPFTISCKRRSYVVYAVKLRPNSCPIKILIQRRFKGELSNKFFIFKLTSFMNLKMKIQRYFYTAESQN